MQNEKIMMVPEYAKLMKVSRPAVTMALCKGKDLKGVKSARKIGRDWVLTVCNDVSKIKSGKRIIIHK